MLPELLFRPAYDQLHRAREFTVDVRRLRYIQKGYREPMLCGACEGHLGRYEKYFADVWFNTPLRPQIAALHTIVPVSGVDYALFKLFHLSLLWRASVSRRAEFQLVRLGPHQERLRRMLLADDPGSPDDYPFWAIFLVDPGSGHIFDDLLLEPVVSRPCGHTVYVFVFGGCCWYYFASSHAAGRPLPVRFDNSGMLRVYATNIFEFTPLTDSFVQFHR